MNQFWGVDADPTAQGRLRGARPVAVLDIGSNSVRLVVYERHARALTPLYNEKSPCSLGRGLGASGRIADENIERAMLAMKRFAQVTRLMRVGKVHILATSAVRDAANRDEFVALVEEIMGDRVRVLSGEEEAHFAALGVVSGINGFAGAVGDLGGGSLELAMLREGQDSVGETHELGVIRVQDDSKGAVSKARAIARSRLKHSSLLKSDAATTFCAIGGTWRSLAKIHQVEAGYPLHMVQEYRAKAANVHALCEAIMAAAAAGKQIPGADTISSSRRELMPFGAAVLAEVIEAGHVDEVVFSALGVREGYLYGLLSAEDRAIDPLHQASQEISLLRSRSPAHAEDLIGFSAGVIEALSIIETPEQKRLREVACYLSDIGWRGHPDYRGEQSVDMVAYGSMVGIGHPGRAFLAEVLAVRYMGLKHKSMSQSLMDLAGEEAHARARLIGATFRVAYPMSAAMPGVLSRAGVSMQNGILILTLPPDLGFLGGQHLQGRLEQLGGVAGVRDTAIITSA